MPTKSSARTRHWSDVVAIATGVISIGFALYGIPLRADDAVDEGLGWTWGISGISGALAVLSVVVAQRHARAGKAMLALAGLLQLAVPLFFERQAAWTTWIAAIVLGVLMLAASPFIGFIAPDHPGEPEAGDRHRGRAAR